MTIIEGSVTQALGSPMTAFLVITITVRAVHYTRAKKGLTGKPEPREPTVAEVRRVLVWCAAAFAIVGVIQVILVATGIAPGFRYVTVGAATILVIMIIRYVQVTHAQD